MAFIRPYSIKRETPAVETYRLLRAEAGLSPKTEQAARLGLQGTLFAVQVLLGDQAVGMGRVVGDGGCVETAPHSVAMALRIPG